jgi:hypothetical protein
VTGRRRSFPPGIVRLVAVPALITLAVTLLRLTGERAGWSERWFSRATQGVTPQAMTWLIGITWLPLPFGIYFGWRLLRAGLGPASPARAALCALAGVAVGLIGLFAVVPRLPLPFPPILLAIWAVMVLAAALQWPAWPELAFTLLVYGLLARMPVVVVMFLAMAGGWGTHYDYVDAPGLQAWPLVPRFLWLAFFPQLVFWVGAAVVLGSVGGALGVALLRRRARRARHERVA